MSSISDVEIDLEKLFLPAWAQEPAAANRYAKFAGEPAEREDRKREGRRGPRREPFGEPRRSNSQCCLLSGLSAESFSVSRNRCTAAAQLRLVSV